MSSAYAARFAGLPAPQNGKLTLYVFGPGFGESQVMVSPGGKWVVVDSCVHEGVNLPLELLRHFGAQAIDLLIVTHPDLDHYKGFPDLVNNFEVKRFWRYPGFATSRDVIMQLEKDQPDNTSFREMGRLYDAMSPLMKTGKGRQAVYDQRHWLDDTDTPCQITCIAPCPQEMTYELEQLAQLFKRVQPERVLANKDKRQLMGKANRLSLALVIWWRDVGILLGGDVEHDPGQPNRGWTGILAVMREDESLDQGKKLDLLRRLRVVKIPHHGSKGPDESGICEEVWKLHASDGPVELAIGTRFDKGKNPPPHASTLSAIRPYARQLALTSAPEGDFAVATDAGWVRLTHASGPGDAACVAVTLAPSTPADVALSSQSALFGSVATAC